MLEYLKNRFVLRCAFVDRDKLDLLFSKERIDSYNNVEEHFRNLRLIARITPKIAVIELIIRNLLDYEMCKINKDWLRSYPDSKISSKILQIDKKDTLSHTQILSKLSLGEIKSIINAHVNIYNKIFALENFYFRKYDSNNKDFYKDKSKRKKFTNSDKAEIVMGLFSSIRNRCFHWENLLKVRENKGKIYSRITHKCKGTIIGVSPKNIELFLDDIIKSFDTELLELLV